MSLQRQAHKLRCSRAWASLLVGWALLAATQPGGPFAFPGALRKAVFLRRCSTAGVCGLAGASAVQLCSPGTCRRSLGVIIRQAVKGQIVDLERRALAAAEAWDTDVTEFLDEDVVEAVEERCRKLADVACVRIGGYPGARRARLALTRGELIEASGKEELEHGEHAVLLFVSADLGSSDPLPNVLDNIGITFDQVGDVRVDGDSAYMVLAPDAAKKAQRLLRRALATVTITDVIAPGTVIEGDLQELVVQRLDRRSKKGKR